ncbi:MAG: hypothetical protein OXJ37_22290 [Bryobacterales bacterium]|nr:hypothetical protein [Bryobacterales bacterium]
MDLTETGTHPSHRDPIQCYSASIRAVCQLGLMVFLGLLIGTSAVAQEVITLPLDANGKPQLPPGAVTETAYAINAFAGTGEEGFHGDGGPATQARFHTPGGIAVDTAGNVYVADSNNRRVRRIDPSGNIATIAGNGRQGSAGDGGPATAAQLFNPSDVAVDASGNVYIAEGLGNRVRKIDATGTISTVAGTGEAGSGGDGGPAAQAQLNRPSAIAVDADGNIFVGEYAGYRVRKIDTVGTITTIAGVGTKGGAGDGGPANAAQFNFISGLAVDGSGNVYVSDMNEVRIRKIAPEGTITTIAGTGIPGHTGHGGPAIEARIRTPGGIALDSSGNLFLTEFWAGRLRRIDPAGVITTIAGTGEQSSTGDMGLATDAALDRPRNIAAGSDGRLYVVENYADRIRVLSPTAERSRFSVPLGSSGDSVMVIVEQDGSLKLDGSPLVRGLEVVASNGHRFSFGQTESGGVTATYVPNTQTVELPTGKSVTLTAGQDGGWRIGDQVATNGYRHVEDGREYLLEWTGAQWRLAKYTIRTIAGTVGVAEGVPATEARLFNPYFVALDSIGNVYVSESSNHRVRKIDKSGTITTFAGTGERGYAGDGGPATRAEFDSPRGIAVNWLGEIFVADYANHVVRKIDVLGRISTISTSRPLFNPYGLALDVFGNVLLAESHVRNHLVRRIDSRGNVTTVAGALGQRGGFAGGGSAAAARLNYPRAVAADTMGNVYVADYFNHRVRKIDATGTIATIAGTGERGYAGDGGPAADAQLASPNGLLVDLAGNVYISDSGNARIRKIDSSGMIETIAGPGEPGILGNDGPAVKARLGYPRGLAMDASGNLLIAESAHDIVRRISPSGTITPFAGTGEPFDRRNGGAASAAQFGYPDDVAADATGNVYVLDSNQVRRIDPSGMIAAIAGTGEYGHSGDGGPAIAADLQNPTEMGMDVAGNLYLAERFGHRVRKIDVAGTITTIAGTGERGYSGDGGPATKAQVDSPRSIAVDSVGNVYVADQNNHRVRRIDTSGVITTYVGTGIRDRTSEFGYVASTGDGQSDYHWDPGGTAPADRARLTSPYELAVDTNNILYVFDSGNRSSFNARVGKIDTASAEPLITPLPPMDVPRFVTGFDVDDSGNVFVFSSGSVLMFNSDGSGTTVAGGGETRFAGNGEPAGGVFMGRFANIALGANGNIWVADSSSRRVHVLEPVP